MSKPDRKRSKSSGNTSSEIKVVARNRRARRDYEILATLEVGLVLVGSEVKSLRESHVQLNKSWAQVNQGELWLHGLHIVPYSHAATTPSSQAGTGSSSAGSGHDPGRVRKLLAHRHEIQRLNNRLERERLSLIPLSLYFSSGRAKVELALARGRSRADRRSEIARADAEREAQRTMADIQRGRYS